MAEVEVSEGSSDFADDSFSLGGEADEPEKAKHESDADDEPDGDPNKGWADAMAKILNKPISSEKSGGTILVKSKALVKEKERVRLEKLEKKKQTDKKQQWEMMCRVKPDVIRDRELERNLQKIATRGVVQLFNAVRTHQGKVSDKLKDAGNSERKRSKLMSSVSKKDFIDVLRGKESKSENADRKIPKKNSTKSESASEWNILRDDFMMGASMKDWDKDSNDEEVDAEAGAEDYSGSDSDR